MTTAPPITETEWQAQVVELAAMLGWRCLHVRRSIGGTKQGWRTTTSIVGWPDLLCWKAGAGFVALELKVGKGKPTTEQAAVLAELAAAGARTMVAWPADLDAVVALLKPATAKLAQP